MLTTPLDSPTHRVEVDTPDVVICGPDWLLAIEAKFFHRPTSGQVDAQMRRQQTLVTYWRESLRLDPDRVAHVLLLPERLLRDRPGLDLSWPVVTWEELLTKFAMAGDPYWLGVLHTALNDYERLASDEPTFGANAEGHLLGVDIDNGGAQSAGFGYVGRAGGKDGKPFAADVATREWRARRYEMRKEPPPPGNRNWMTIDEFRNAVASNRSGDATDD